MSAPHPSDDEATAVAKAGDPTPTPSLFASRRAPKHDIHSVMTFDQLLKKVEQAEDALEARERRVVADWRRLQATWRAAWTPGRVLLAGLASGFAFGRAARGRTGGGGAGFLRILSTVSGLVASVNAQLAAHEAEHVSDRMDAATAHGGFDDEGPCDDGRYDAGPYGDGPYDDGPYDDGFDDRGPHARGADARDVGGARADEGRRDAGLRIRIEEDALSPDEAVRRAGAESARP